MFTLNSALRILCFLIIICSVSKCSDITHLVFGDRTDGMPAAFGDFNSDELTDVFVLRNNLHTMEILLAHEEEPLLRPSRPDPLSCTFKEHLITSVVPGDFDGDALMDVMVTTIKEKVVDDLERRLTYVYIIWGGATYLNCSDGFEDNYMVHMIGQPLAIDFNQDMIIDLFGQSVRSRRMFWVFGKTRDKPMEIEMEENSVPLPELKVPHSHAFLGKLYIYGCESNQI
ncbi:unnamed protein product [Acanthoscelides obtectus]|uniref:Uncharacterized protein n=1 Tax=Acanthoscelides obtectus TaxID=200917 RepID=A0A9P0LPR9_ACAOB|nr:unnamed protein product [Acanthoscelides obtectus]CAK1619940.1 T-cell immunomodulatory protein [Acanthoscelides obtectus]